MAEFTLHCFAQSGNAYKPALLLELAGADWEPRFVDYFKGETRTAAWRAINVMGEAPVLEHRGLVLSQSGVILDYLAEHFPAFAPRGDRREALRWLLFDNHKLTSYTATYRFMRSLAPVPPDPAVVAEFRKRAEAAWAVLETHLGDRAWVVGDALSTLDLSMCGYLFWEEEIGVDWKSSHPAIHGWLGRIRSQPRWVHPYDLMPGHPRPA